MEGTFRKKLSYSYSFDERMERIVSLWTNSLLYKNLYSNFIEEIKFIQGKSYADKGAKMVATCKRNISIYMEVVDVVKKAEYTKIEINHSMLDQAGEEKVLKSIEIYHFYWNTVQCQTILIIEMVILDESFYNCLKSEKTEEERMNIFKRFELYVKRLPYYYEQAESVIIEKDQETIWKVVTNFELFKIYAPGVGDSIKYDGNPLDLDTKLHIYSSDKTKEYHLKVIKCKIEDEKRIYALTYFAGVPKAPHQDLFFIIVKFSDNKCLLIFKHVFKKFVEFILIKKIAEDKKKMLIQLKEKIEHLE